MKCKPLNQVDFAMRIVEDLGTKYITEHSKVPRRRAIFECTECLINFEASTSTVKSRKQILCKSCSMSSHKGSTSRLYTRWRSMKDRCYNTASPSYPMYGGKGVTICDEWRNSFGPYRDWCLDNGYSFNLELDKDIGSNRLGISPAIYSPETCTFVTKERNMQATRLLMRTNSTGYRGVYKERGTKFRSRIQVNKKEIFLGIYDTALDAAKAYDSYILLNNTNHTRNNVCELADATDYILHREAPRRSNTTGYSGVSPRNGTTKFTAQVSRGPGTKQKHIGTFQSIADAVKSRNEYLENNDELLQFNKIQPLL